VITPLIAAILGKRNFANSQLHHPRIPFRLRGFLNALLSFVLVACVIFFLVVKPVNHLMDRLGLTPRGTGARLPRVPEQGPTGRLPMCLLHVGADAHRLRGDPVPDRCVGGSHISWWVVAVSGGRDPTGHRSPHHGGGTSQSDEDEGGHGHERQPRGQGEGGTGGGGRHGGARRSDWWRTGPGSCPTSEGADPWVSRDWTAGMAAAKPRASEGTEGRTRPERCG
jgi:uncharacterized membrane protein YgcG